MAKAKQKRYEVKDPRTGHTRVIQSDKPPTEQQIRDAFKAPPNKPYVIEPLKDGEVEARPAYRSSLRPPPASPEDHMTPAERDQARRGTVANHLLDAIGWGTNAAMTLPEAGVGLADIATLGRAGKFLDEKAGFRPDEARRIVSSYMSPAQQEAEKALQDAQGVSGTLSAIAQHPRLALQAGVESVPLMLSGGVVGRGIGALGKVGRAIPTAVRVGAGEGLGMAGSQAAHTRQESPTGHLTPTQAGLATLTGVVGAATGYGGGRIAEKFGIVDPDTLIAEGFERGVEAARRGVAARVAGGAASEGLLEELPQTLVETASSNIAGGRPATEGMGKAATMGTVVGGIIGGGVNVPGGNLSTVGQAPAQAPPQAPVQPPTDPAFVAEFGGPAARQAATVDSASGQAGRQRSPISPDAPIAARDNTGAAAVQMMNEDPTLVARAEEMRRQGMMAKQALNDSHKGRGGGTLAGVGMTGPQVVSDAEFEQRTVPVPPEALGGEGITRRDLLRGAVAATAANAVAHESMVADDDEPAQPRREVKEPTFRGWQEVLPGQPPVPLYDWPLDPSDPTRFTTGSAGDLAKAGFEVPEPTHAPPGAGQWTDLEDLMDDQRDVLEKYQTAPQTPSLTDRLRSEIGQAGRHRVPMHSTGVPQQRWFPYQRHRESAFQSLIDEMQSGETYRPEEGTPTHEQSMQMQGALKKLAAENPERASALLARIKDGDIQAVAQLADYFTEQFGEEKRPGAKAGRARSSLIDRLLGSEVGQLGDFVEDEHGRPVAVREQNPDLDRAQENMDRLMSGADATATISEALTAAGRKPEQVADFQKQANRAGEPVNVWTDGKKRVVAVPASAKGGAAPFEGAQLVGTLQPQAAPAAQPSQAAPKERPPEKSWTGLDRLRSRIETGVLPQATKPMLAGKFDNIVKKAGVKDEESEFSGLRKWLEPKLAAEAKLQNPDLTREERAALQKLATVTPEDVQQMVAQSRMPVFENLYAEGEANSPKWATGSYVLPGPREDDFETVVKWPEFQQPPDRPVGEIKMEVGQPVEKSDQVDARGRSGPYEETKVLFRLPDGTRQHVRVLDFSKHFTAENAQKAMDRTQAAYEAALAEVFEEVKAVASEAQLKYLFDEYGLGDPNIPLKPEDRAYDQLSGRFYQQLRAHGGTPETTERLRLAGIEWRQAGRQMAKLGVDGRKELVNYLREALKPLDEYVAANNGVVPIDEEFMQKIMNPPHIDDPAAREPSLRLLLDERGYPPELIDKVADARDNLQRHDRYYKTESGGIILKGPEADGTVFHKGLDDALAAYKREIENRVRRNMRRNVSGLNFQQTGHYPDTNPIAHLRTSRRTINGVQTRLVDEMQADLHKAATKPPRKGEKGRGYQEPLDVNEDLRIQDEVTAETAAALDDANSLQEELESHYPPAERPDFEGLDDIPSAASSLKYRMNSHVDAMVADGTLTDEQAASFKQRAHDILTRMDATQKKNDARESLNALSKLPNIPFKGNDWVSLMLRRAISLAIDRGDTAIAVTPGNAQSKRWNALLENIKAFNRYTDSYGNTSIQFNGSAVSDDQLDEVESLLEQEPGREDELDRFKKWRAGEKVDSNPEGLTEVEEEEGEEEITEDDIDRDEAPIHVSESEQEDYYIIADSDGDPIDLPGGRHTNYGTNRFDSEREAQSAMENLDPPAYTSEEERWVINDSNGDPITNITNGNNELLDDGEGRFTSEEDAEDALEEWKRQNPDADPDELPSVDQGDSVYIVRDRNGDPIDDEEFDDEDAAYEHMESEGHYHRVVSASPDPQWEVYNSEGGDSDYYDDEDDAHRAYREAVDEWVREQVEERNRNEGRTKKKKDVSPDDFVFSKPLSVGARGYIDVYDRRAVKDLTEWLKPYGVKPERKPVQAYEITGGSNDPEGRTKEQLSAARKQALTRYEVARDQMLEIEELRRKYADSVGDNNTAQDQTFDGSVEHPRQQELFDYHEHMDTLDKLYEQAQAEAKMHMAEDTRLGKLMGKDYEVRAAGDPNGRVLATFTSREEAEKYKSDKENETYNSVWWVKLPDDFIKDVKSYGLPLMMIPLALGLGAGGGDDDKKKKPKKKPKPH